MRRFAGGFGGGAGAAGGLLNASTPGRRSSPSSRRTPPATRWVAATTGADSAAGYQLATDDPVMAIGGFNGTDPSPTLAQFQKYVAEGRIHYYISGGGGFGGGGFGDLEPRQRHRSDATAISSWVTFTPHGQDRGRCHASTTCRSAAVAPAARGLSGRAGSW